jgi:hypothetical protein
MLLLCQFFNVHRGVICLFDTNTTVRAFGGLVSMDVPVDIEHFLTFEPVLLQSRRVYRDMSKEKVLKLTPKHYLREEAPRGKKRYVVMVAHNQTLLAIQSRPKLFEAVLTTKEHITKVIDFISRLNHLVPVVDHSLIHMLKVFEVSNPRTI